MEIILVQSEELRGLIESSLSSVSSRQKERGGTDDQVIDKKWIGNREAMKMLGLSRATLQRYRAEKLFPYSKIGGNIYYRRADIENLLERNLRIPPEAAD